MKILLTKFYKAVLLMSFGLLLGGRLLAQITLTGSCLNGITVPRDPLGDFNGKGAWANETSTYTLTGLPGNTGTGLYIWWAVSGDVIPNVNNKWVIVVFGGNNAFLYHPTATSDFPPATGWVQIPGSPYTCANTENLVLSGEVTLPIELTQFNAITEGSKTRLTWTTASEENNSHFDIERSIDGNTFHSIAQVKGKNKASKYQYIDNQPFSITYYRLKQVDFDGTTSYSKVVSATNKGSKALKVYPTLVSNGILIVDTDLSQDYQEGGQLRDFSVTNLLGQQVLAGKMMQQIDVSALAKGTYVLKVGTEVAKFVKQ